MFCWSAIMHERMNVLEWIKENRPYLFSKESTDIALERYKQTILLWLYKNECPIRKKTLSEAKRLWPDLF